MSVYDAYRAFRIALLLAGCSAFLFPKVFGASTPPKQRSTYVQEKTVPLHDIHAGLSNLRHDVSNHEIEIRILEEKLTNQEDTLETLRQKVLDSSQNHRDLLRNSNSSLDAKVDAVDAKTKGLAADLGILKNHANETSSLLAQYKQKISELENTIETQKQQMHHLETAIRSLLDLIQGKDGIAENTAEAGTTKIYRVQPGDTLEKIAKTQKTTIQALKERNNLNQDKIIVGQKLIIP